MTRNLDRDPSQAAITCAHCGVKAPSADLMRVSHPVIIGKMVPVHEACSLQYLRQREALLGEV